MQFGPYILEERVGRGAMAEVWSGWHAGRTDRVAIKILTRLAEHAESELDAFFHEVRTVASLSHPGIVQILDYGQARFDPLDTDVPYLVTELGLGGTLGTGWRAGTFADVRRTLLAILDALAHAHARGVIHRDLKPGNVLRMTADPDSPLKVTDFGVARLAPMGERSFADGLIAGTPKYMAPEQVRGDWRDHGPWTDLYAVACIAWTMVTGKPLFAGTREDMYRAHLEDEPPALVPLLTVPDGLEDWLRWLLSKQIGDRCRRAADASMELLALQLPDDPHTIEVSYFLDEPSGSFLASSDELMVSSSLGQPPERVQRLRELADASHALDDDARHTELRLWGLRRVPFVGRRAERTKLWSTLQHAFESGTPQLAVLEGPAGAGKSAVARWLTERSHELGLANPMRVVHDPISRSNDGVRGALMRTFHLEDLHVADAVGRLRNILAPYVDDAEALQVAGVIGDWVAATDDDAASNFEHEERARALLCVLRVLSGPRIPLLWVEDADRATGTIRMLARAIELGSDAPPRLMIVATTTEAAELAELGASCETHRLPLPDLSAEEAGELLDAMLPLAPHFRASLLEQTASNPLYTIQMLGALIAGDQLVMNTHGEFEVRDTAVPTTTFSELLDVRIQSLADALGADAKNIRQQLEIAAAFGRTVRPIEWLVASGKNAMPVRRDLVDAMVRAGLAVPADEHWAFAHELVRDELVSSARRAGRWRHHNALCAAALEDLYPRPDSQRRALYLLEAEHWSLAADACVAAAESAQRDQTTSWLERAITALDRSGAPEDDLRRTAVQRLRERE